MLSKVIMPNESVHASPDNTQEKKTVTKKRGQAEPVVRRGVKTVNTSEKKLPEPKPLDILEIPELEIEEFALADVLLDKVDPQKNPQEKAKIPDTIKMVDLAQNSNLVEKK